MVFVGDSFIPRVVKGIRWLHSEKLLATQRLGHRLMAPCTPRRGPGTKPRRVRARFRKAAPSRLQSGTRRSITRPSFCVAAQTRIENSTNSNQRPQIPKPELCLHLRMGFSSPQDGILSQVRVTCVTGASSLKRALSLLERQN